MEFLEHGKKIYAIIKRIHLLVLHKIDFVNFLHPLTKFLNVEFFIKFYKIIDKTLFYYRLFYKTSVIISLVLLNTQQYR